MLASVIANVNRGKSQRAYEPKDFMPEFGGEPPKPKTPKQLGAMLNSLAAMLNAKRKKQEGVARCQQPVLANL